MMGTEKYKILDDNRGAFLQRQKVRQRISVMKTNTVVFVVFKTKCQNELCVFSLLIFSDIILDDPYLTL